MTAIDSYVTSILKELRYLRVSQTDICYDVTSSLQAQLAWKTGDAIYSVKGITWVID